MKQLIEAIDNLPKLVKLILCIPMLDIVWWIYRVCKSLDKNNTVGVVLAVILAIIASPIVWLIDLICVLVKGNVWWLD